MNALCKQIRDFHGDQAGASTVEWILLLVAVGLPSFYLFGILINALAELYRMVTFMETLPFP